MKIALGTVQMGMDYGQAKFQSKTPKDVCSQILELAKVSGIALLDTAIRYGESEKTLGDIGIRQWRVVTKLPAVPSGAEILPWMRNEIRGSLDRLNINKLYGILLHRPDQLNTSKGNSILHSLLAMKEEGLCENIGISIYDPAELDPMPLDSLDIVQAPVNLLDRRIITSGWLKKLKRAGIEIHARSVFLQGLLLLDDAERPSKFDKWSTTWSIYRDWLAKTGLTRLQACMSFVNSIDEIDQLIVGVNSEQQLREIIEANDTCTKSFPERLSINDSMLLNPSNWR